MGHDYQVLAFRDSAPLQQVGIAGKDPVTLAVHGRAFVGVSRVLINGVESPEFIVFSETKLWAQVPDSQLQSRISEVQVLLSRSGLTAKSTITFEAIVPGARASGFNRLLQAFLRLLLMNPGEDLNDASLGGGFYAIVGSSGTPGELKSAAALAVSNTETQLIGLQARNAHLTVAEKLQSAALLSAEYVSATTSLNVRIRLTAMDGTTGAATVRV